MDLAAKDTRRPCKYGAKCYQQNPMHTEKFSHPDRDKDKVAKKAEEAARRKRNRPLPKGKRRVDSSDEESTPVKAPKKDSPEKCSPVAPTTPDDQNNEAEKASCSKENENPDTAEEEESDLVTSPESDNPKTNLKDKFLVEFPDDFFSFWDFCKERNPKKPREALLRETDLMLVGPFEVYSGEIGVKQTQKLNDYLTHWRYYYDVPEFQTILANVKTGFHVGYFRDHPQDMPNLVASNKPNEGCQFTTLGDNLFGALHNLLKKMIRTASDPFKVTALEKLKESVHVYATMKASGNSALEPKTQQMRNRDKRCLTATFHTAGMVVPFDKKTELGYRPIPETTGSLKKIFKGIIEAKESSKVKAMEPLYELITNVQFANDESDPGMGLELGIDAFCYGGERLQKPAEHLMCMGYGFVGRSEYCTVLRAHLKRRPKDGCKKTTVFRINH